MTSYEARRDTNLFRVFLGVVFVAVLLVARANRGTFPFPNEDEATFFIPSWNLAVFGNLRPAALNAPDGIYWVPHGFYVWNAAFLRLFGATPQVAVAVSEVAAAAAVVVLLSGLARVAGSRGFAALCAVVLVSPATILAANTIRMEGLIVLLYAAALWLHTRRCFIPAVGLLALSLLVHPALGLSLGLYVALLLVLAVSNSPAVRVRLTSGTVAGNLIVILIVVSAFAAEARLLASHWELFREQMAYQAQRKGVRTVADILLHRRGILLVAEMVILGALGILARSADAGRRFLAEIAPVGLMALGLQAYAAIGYELPYAVYSYSIVPATLVCAAYGTTMLIESPTGRTL